jgi:hypothetical protein
VDFHKRLGPNNDMKAQSIFLAALLLTNFLRGQQPSLHVTVVAGEGAKYNIDQKVRVEPVVQVTDDAGKPVEGATVAFALPDQGAGGTFENGTHTLTVPTNPQGRATALGIRLNDVIGPFTIRVTASYQGGTATATIAQSIVRIKHSSGAFGVTPKTLVILSLALVGIAGGIVAYKEFKPGPNPNVLTATPGVPVVGGPQ